MITKDQILAALKKLGPSSPTAIANNIGAEPSAVGHHLRAMLKAKTLKAAGSTGTRVYALPDQDLEGAKAAPPQRRKKAKKAGKRKSPKAARPRPAAAQAGFLPAITAANSLVLVHPGEAAQIFSVEQTQAIADLLVQHFEV